MDFYRRWKAGRIEHAERTRLLRQITEASGGRLIETDIDANLEDVFQKVVFEIGTLYLLAYRLREGIAPGWHEIRV